MATDEPNPNRPGAAGVEVERLEYDLLMLANFYGYNALSYICGMRGKGAKADGAFTLTIKEKQ